MDAIVKKVAEVAKQTGHGVTHQSPFPAQQKKDVEQAAQHNRDMARIEKQHLRGLKGQAVARGGTRAQLPAFWLLAHTRVIAHHM